ncbi:hypothetical protein TSAR_005584 [Trichomalopsis sarcophagae]|uniref:Uncharacterized protein n=1 Tax=Trichomalopsis sarcophagae TaxID=543379 RepID=A0A232EVY5_9HYME|nr:hypothetical protein TSAR_005584 [Trichomalopsis sarcophagae]
MRYNQKQNAIYEQNSIGTFRRYVGLRLWLPDSPVVATGDSLVSATLCYQVTLTLFFLSVFYF